MKFQVSTSFYDNGRTVIKPPVPCADNAVSSCVQDWNRDTYTDIFDSFSDAVEFYLNNKEA